jgi:nitroreductase
MGNPVLYGRNTMDYETLLTLIKKRRTIRKYKSISIPDEYIESVIEAARWAPSGANAQPWEFIVVEREETKKKMLGSLMGTGEVIRREKPASPWQSLAPRLFIDPPVLIVVCGDPRLSEAYPLGEVREEIFTSSLAAAIQNIHLAATALGLEGSTWITVGPLAGVRLKELLGIPQVLKVRAVLPLGYPAHRPKPPFRRRVDDILHRDKYDMGKFRTDEDIKEFINTKALRGLSDFRVLWPNRIWSGDNYPHDGAISQLGLDTQG